MWVYKAQISLKQAKADASLVSKKEPEAEQNGPLTEDGMMEYKDKITFYKPERVSSHNKSKAELCLTKEKLPEAIKERQVTSHDGKDTTKRVPSHMTC